MPIDEVKPSKTPQLDFTVEDNPEPSVSKAVTEAVNQTAEDGHKIKAHNSAVYEEIQLPSKGAYYGGKLPDGKIRIRMMYQEEEEIMTSVRYIQNGKAIDMVLENVIESLPQGFTTQDLLATDRTYLLMWLRMTSYGTEYETELTCPQTKKTFRYTFDLEQCEIRDIRTDEAGNSIPEPFELELKVSKLKIKFKLPRGKDEVYLAKVKDDEAEGVKVSLNAERMKRLITEVTNLKTGETETNPVFFRELYLNNIPAGDGARFRNELEYVSSGMKLTQKVISPYTGVAFKSGIPINADFFSVADHRI